MNSALPKLGPLLGDVLHLSDSETGAHKFVFGKGVLREVENHGKDGIEGIRQNDHGDNSATVRFEFGHKKGQENQEGGVDPDEHNQDNIEDFENR